ncbi:MAG: hypothetical protein WD971_02415 [Pirellulales bacterium]
MVQDPRLECSFLIPVRRDANLSDGDEHDPDALDWLTIELFDRFHGATIAPGKYQGFYEDPDTHARVSDESYKYIVAVEESRVPELRQLLSTACVFFKQKCIYLSVAGHVEFIEPP